jgi:hypothetical protein
MQKQATLVFFFSSRSHFSFRSTVDPIGLKPRLRPENILKRKPHQDVVQSVVRFRRFRPCKCTKGELWRGKTQLNEVTRCAVLTPNPTRRGFCAHA